MRGRSERERYIISVVTAVSDKIAPQHRAKFAAARRSELLDYLETLGVDEERVGATFVARGGKQDVMVISTETVVEFEPKEPRVIVNGSPVALDGTAVDAEVLPDAEGLVDVEVRSPDGQAAQYAIHVELPPQSQNDGGNDLSGEGKGDESKRGHETAERVAGSNPRRHRMTCPRHAPPSCGSVFRPNPQLWSRPRYR